MTRSADFGRWEPEPNLSRLELPPECLLPPRHHAPFSGSSPRGGRRASTRPLARVEWRRARTLTMTNERGAVLIWRPTGKWAQFEPMVCSFVCVRLFVCRARTSSMLHVRRPPLDLTSSNDLVNRHSSDQRDGSARRGNAPARQCHDKRSFVVAPRLESASVCSRTHRCYLSRNQFGHSSCDSDRSHGNQARWRHAYFPSHEGPEAGRRA